MLRSANSGDTTSTLPIFSEGGSDETIPLLPVAVPWCRTSRAADSVSPRPVRSDRFTCARFTMCRAVGSSIVPGCDFWPLQEAVATGVAIYAPSLGVTGEPKYPVCDPRHATPWPSPCHTVDRDLVVMVKGERGSDRVNHAAIVDVGDVQFSNLALGLSVGIALLAAGMILALRSTGKRGSPAVAIAVADEATAAGTATATDHDRSRNRRVSRPRLSRRSLLGLAILLPIPVVVLLRDVGRSAAARREHTIWATGVRLVTDVSGRPIRRADLEIGALVHAIPETLAELPELDRPEAKAKAAIVLVRMPANEISPARGRENWHVDGIIAYSKICTHVGCPMGLYERTTHHLLCPCHQSTFDLADNGAVVFGPATRALPQLPLATDADGFVVALSDFTEPVGPSYWERVA